MAGEEGVYMGEEYTHSLKYLSEYEDMTIAIDLTSLSYHLTGIERFASCVTESLVQQDEQDTFILIFRDKVEEVFQPLIDGKRVRAEILHGNHKLLFFQVVLPYHLYKIKADKYLFLAFTSPILFRREGIINTIHDMGAWDAAEAMTGLQKFYFRVCGRVAAKSAEQMLTVSEFSKKRIHDILGYPLEKIHVAYSAVYERMLNGPMKDFSEIRAKYSLPEKYILTLSTIEPRKNMRLLLEAYSVIADQVDYELVLVGRKGWMTEELVAKYSNRDRIHITGFVDDEDISSIYKNAICFVFPSLYEGFGIPPIESLVVGTPVISSDAASLPEVLMDQAVYFKSNDMDELRELLVGLKQNLDAMPRELNEYQRENFTAKESALRVKKLLTS